MHELQDEEEPPMETLLDMLAPCDLVLIEEYKRENHDKIEVIRSESLIDKPRWPEDDTIVAIAAKEQPDGCTLPCFDPDDIGAIADFIVGRLSLENPGDRHAAE